MTMSREVRFRQRPEGVPTADVFELAEVDLPAPGPGEVQVKNLYMSVDPYMRGRMTDRPSYVPPFKLGEALQGGAIGEVTASNDPSLKPGDLVNSMLGWREAFNAPAAMLQKIEPRGLAPQAFLGVAGMPGLTAYVGLLQAAGLKDGDVVFVSAAAGAVGSVACQIAKIKGATVIGSAGGADKLAYLHEIGCDAVIDYRAEPDMTTALQRAAPKGIDVYFDNVGGDHLEAALTCARPFGRFALCGMISAYNDATPAPGPSNLSLIVGKRLKLQGFIVSDHFDLMPRFGQEIAGWIGEGRMRWRETVDEGIEAAPAAFMKLFSGDKIGKMLVKLA